MGPLTRAVLLGLMLGCTIEGFRHWDQFHGLPWLLSTAIGAAAVALLPPLRPPS